MALGEPLIEAVAETECEDLHVAFLADTVDAANALDNAKGVPRGVVVDDDVAELQVDAFPAGLGRDEEAAGRVLAEAADGFLAGIRGHSADDDAEAPRRLEAP